MFKQSIDDLRVDFVMHVYESITKQIQQMDLKISILISWDGIIAVGLAREITQIITNRLFSVSTIAPAAICILALLIAGWFCYRVLKPRQGTVEEDGFAGLLYSGDILKLGNGNQARMVQYMNELIKIDDHEKLYQQFIKSIVLISGISMFKNRMFTRGLLATLISFTGLVGVMAVVNFNLTKLIK